MYSFSTFVKDPNAKLDYGIDWSSWLRPGDGISASTWTVGGPDGSLTTYDPAFTGTQTTVWLQGGTEDGTYLVTNHITTSAGREDDRTIEVRMEQR